MNLLKSRGGVRAALRASARALILLTTPLPILAATAADPSDSSEDTAVMEDEIIVLGSRTPLAPSALAGSSTRFGPAELAAAQQPFVADLLRTVPMNISRSGGFGGLTQVRMRGSEANHTLVLLDGFELNDPANGSEYDFAHLRGTSMSGSSLPGPWCIRAMRRRRHRTVYATRTTRWPSGQRASCGRRAWHLRRHGTRSAPRSAR